MLILWRQTSLVSNTGKPWPLPTVQICALILAISAALQSAINASHDYCYTDIGCFPLTRDFYHPRHRPFNARPWHRRHIKTQFELFNRQHPEGFMLIPWNRYNLQHSAFNPLLETKVIVPGWLDNVNRALWVKRLRDALLWNWSPVNIIIVRWRNFTPYTFATANTRVVGAELANLIKFLEHELDYDRAYYHIIGHSLGAHIGGYTGDRVPGLGRITALDPARPFFQGMPKSVRLDRGDAKFVDVIHSDFTPENAIFLIMSFGMSIPVGHVDFYPNGPPLFQPGCMRDSLTSVQDGISKGLQHNSLSVAFLEAIRYLTACDHQRSHEWFIESINNRGCLFVGVRCDDFDGVIDGRCSCDDSRSACAIMGIHADQMYMHGCHEDVWPVSGRAPRPVAPSFDTMKTHMPSPIQYHAPRFVNEHLSIAQQLELEVPLVPKDFHGSLEQLSAYLTSVVAAQMDQPQHNLDWLSKVPEATWSNYLGQHNQPPTKQEIYARLRQNIDQQVQRPEPQIMDFEAVDLDPNASGHHVSTTRANVSSNLGVIDKTVSYDMNKNHHEHDWSADSLDTIFWAPERNVKMAFDDLAFARYLRDNLLGHDLNKLVDRKSTPKQSFNFASGLGRNMTQRRQDEMLGALNLAGHPKLVSGMLRDTENWYEGTSRWFLKTNSRPNYCSNQYQLLIFLGQLNTVSGRDRLRANLIVSLIGTRGKLLNQRFVPRGATLNSYAMQPFYILLEGSYSLGQIHSVTLAWEIRNDPDPIQATVSFNSNPMLEAAQSQILAYKTRNNPWIPKTTMYDRSKAFRWNNQSIQRRVGDSFNKKQRHTSQVVSRIPEDISKIKASEQAISHKGRNYIKKKRKVANIRRSSQYTLHNYATAQDIIAKQMQQIGLDRKILGMQNTHQPSIPFSTNMPKYGHKQYIADDDSESMLEPLLSLSSAKQLVPNNALDLQDALSLDESLPVVDLHNLNLIPQIGNVREDSIVVSQVVVAPIQAGYGLKGRNSRAFCPPGGVGQKLDREQTIRLLPSPFGRCFSHRNSFRVFK